jgi:serine/threonine protein kinase
MDPNLVTLNHRYTPLQLLGAGNFGCVVLAYDAVEEETVAVKVLLPSNYHSRYVQDELIHHNLLNEHPHIIKFREVFLSDDRHLCLAMEYAGEWAPQTCH